MTIAAYLPALLILGGLAAVFGTLLAVASKVLHVDIDPRITEVEKVLPGTNCAICGYVGCASYAQAVVSGQALVDGCRAGGIEVAKAVGRVMGVDVEHRIPDKAYVLCRGGSNESPKKVEYQGIKECRLANMVGGGDKACTYGCLGYGDCAVVCPQNVIKMNENGLPEIDVDGCTGCNACVEICPRNVIALIPENATPFVACVSHDKARDCREVCQASKKPIGCIACKACIKVCPVDAIDFIDELVVINPEKCNGCGECVKKCPTSCILTRQLPNTGMNEDHIVEPEPAKQESTA